MTVRVTVTWVRGDEKVQYEVATDAGYCPDILDDCTSRVRDEFVAAVNAVRGVAAQ